MDSTEPQASTTNTDRTGFLQSLGCYLLWGIMPLYWRLLSMVPALELLAWRMVWSCAALIALCVFVKKARFLYLLRDRRAVRTFVAAGVVITLNWGVYVWATNSGHLLETSIGYYLCPLCNIALGMLVFKERLTPMQKLATVLAAVGVGFFMIMQGGSIWVSFVLASTFSVYGAVKKKGAYPALPGMAFESLLTGILGAVAIAFAAVTPWLWQLTPATPDPMAVVDPAGIFLLLVGCGILTAVPLLLYSAAANRVSMTILGFMQYIAPTIGLVLALTLFHEDFTMAHGVCFALIWLGIAAVAVESILSNRKTKATLRDALQ